MRRIQRLWPVTAALAVLFVGLTAAPAGALSVTRAEVRGGSEVRIEGEDAVNNAQITVDGVVRGSADGSGEFRLEYAGFTSATCVIAVSDGSGTDNVTVSGCTPTSANTDPIADAGGDRSIVDVDGSGDEVVTLDGSASTDAEGSIVSYSWTTEAVQLGVGATLDVTLPVGTHTIVLTVTDSDGATATDTALVTIAAAPPGSNTAPTANAGPNQTVVDVDGDGAEIVVLDGSASADADGSIVSYEWTDNGVALSTADNVLGLRAANEPVALDDWFEQTASGIAAAEYEATDSENGLQAPNRANNIRTIFGSGGVKIIDRETSADLVDLTLEGIGRPGGLETVAPGSVSNDGTRVEIDRDGVTEWYQNSAAGLEQGFTIDAPPAGSGPLMVEMAVDHAAASLLGGRVRLESDGGRTLSYDKLVTFDAGGNVVPSRLEVPDSGTIRIVVDDSAAKYPLVIDPVVSGTFDQILESNQPDPPGIVPNKFGATVASLGDVNGDGFDDVGVGSPVWDGGQLAEGAVFIFLGSANGIVGNSPATAHAKIEGDSALAQFSVIDSAGDVNGDGFSDVIVGAPTWESVLPGTQLGVDGAAFVFHGSAAGITATTATNADQALFGNQIGSGFGSPAEAAGDVNGDGFDDIVITAPNQGTLFPPEVPPNDASGNYGVVLVYHGGPNGITGTGVDDADAKILPYVDTGQPLPPVDAGIGSGTAAGDVNGDGFADVVAGGSQVTLYLGGPGGITAQNIFDAQSTIQGSPTLQHSQSISGAGAGLQVDGAGDVNGDGFADLVVGNPFRDRDPQDANLGEGAAYVVLGSSGGYGIGSLADANAVWIGELGAENVGRAIAGAGDVDNDGFDDVLIGSLHYAGSLDSEGGVYLFRGGPQGVSSTSLLDADVRLEARQSGAIRLANQYAFDIDAAGDVNGDGFADVIVGKGYWDNGEVNEGAAFLYLGGPFAPGQNQPPVADAGPDRTIDDVDTDGFVTTTFDGTASFDPDGSIVSYEWFSGDTLLGTGPTLTTTLSILGSHGSAGIHNLSLVVTDDQGIRRGDGFSVFIRLVPTTQEFNDGFADLNDWTTTGNVTLGDEGAPFPEPPHALLQGNATMERSFAVAPDTTGVSLRAWIQGSGFSADDSLVMSASFDGGPFQDFFTLDQSNVPTDFVFFNAEDLSTSWWPSTASTVTVRYAATLTGGQVWIANTIAHSIQAPTDGATNTPPVADAGPDQTVVDADGNGLALVALDGSSSTDSDGTITSHEWRRNGVVLGTGPSLSTELEVGTHTLTLVVVDDGGLADTDSVVVTVESSTPAANPTLEVSLPLGVHTITLTVTDDGGATASDTVVITVESPQTNQPPVADAGPDQTYVDDNQDGIETVTVDASASSDSDGSVVAYSWTVDGTVLGSAAELVTDLALGVHDLTLTVIDDQGASSTDTVIITVDALPPNAPPVADAGPDLVIVDLDGDTLEIITFDGTGSSDPDNDIVSYQWTEDGTPLGSTATFSLALPIGVHTVTLTVTDSRGSTSTDTVVVTIDAAPAPGNEPPIANAGSDLTLSDPDGDGLASAVVDGTASSDPDGSIASYQWRLNGTLVGTGATQGIAFPVGTNTLELTVRDDNDAPGSTSITVTVVGNVAPTADAGADQTVSDANGNGAENVQLSAAASSDPDGTVIAWEWRENGSVLSTEENPALDLAIGTHPIELTVTDDGGATATDVVIITVDPSTPPPPAGSIIHVSSTSGGTVSGIRFADEDILAFDPGTDSWAMLLDGSDIGLSGAGARDVDAFHILGDGSMLISITGASTLPDVGSVDDSDIVRFVPTSTGANTAGSFEWYFDGSDVGLTSNGEDVDAVSLLANGDLLVSTSGSASVPGLSGLSDEDVLRFSATSTGSTTAGSWSVHIDGSDLGLNNSGGEDTSGISFTADGAWWFTTRGDVSVSGVTAAPSDLTVCTSLTVGASSSCTSFTLGFDGSGHSFGAENIDGIALG